MQIFLLIVWAFFVNAAAVQAQPAPMLLSLEQAQQRALQAHPRLEAADMRRQAAEQGIREARADYYPQVTLSGVRAVENQDSTRIAATGDINAQSVIDRASYGVKARQLLFDFGSTSRLVDAATAEAGAAAQRYLNTYAKTRLHLTTAYYDALKAQAQRHSAHTVVKTRRLQQQRLSALRAAGQSAALDVNLAEQAVRDAELLLQQADAVVANAMAVLSAAMGENGDIDYTLVPVTEAAPPPSLRLEDIIAAIAAHPELQAAILSQQAATAKAKAAEKARYPLLHAVGYAGQTPYRRRDAALEENYGAAGITVTMPLFTGGALDAKQKRLHFEAQALQQEADEKKQQLLRDMRLLWNTAQMAFDAVAVAKQLDSTSQKTLDLAQARYNLGKKSIVELSRIQLDAARAAAGYQSALYDYLKAKEALGYF